MNESIIAESVLRSFNIGKFSSMNYPTMQQVEHANLFQLVNWGRYLPDPGSKYIDQDDFEKMMEKEVEILDRIIKRRDEIGITPEVSKAVGWERRSDDKGLRPDTSDAKIDIGLNEALDGLEHQEHKMWTAGLAYRGGDIFRVLTNLNLSFGTSTRNSNPTHIIRYKAGEELVLDTEADNGNVWFEDSQGRRGSIMSGSVENLVRRGVLEQMTSLNRKIASEILMIAKDLMAGKTEDDISTKIRDLLSRSEKVVTEDQILNKINFKGSRAVFKKVWDSMIKDEYLIKVSGGYKWNTDGSFTEK